MLFIWTMEQHPVPQNIASYEFRLVGDMTLKQFAELAAGLIVALIFYSTNIPWFLKWPVVFTSSLLGVGLAFFPFEERPLEIWITAFAKAVYSPTQFLWKKNSAIPSFFENRPAVQQKPLLEEAKPQDKLKLLEYVSTLPTPVSQIDQKETDFVTQINNLFTLTPSPTTPQPPPKTKETTEDESKPAGIKVRKLHGPFVIEIEETPLKKQYETRPAVEEVITAPPKIPFSHPIDPPKRIEENRPVSEAKFSKEIPMPSAPTLPNILVGMVTDKDGKILENVIMEIRDLQKNPVRALKTNKLGQFRTVTPLPSGTYEIELEKEGYNFDIIKIDLKGEVVQPIEIMSK